MSDDAKQPENAPDSMKDTDDANVAAPNAENVKGGFNPQPDPPGVIRGFNPQPDPPAFHVPFKNF